MPDPAPATAAPAAAAPAAIVLPEFKPQPVVQPAAESSAAIPAPVADAPVSASSPARAAPRPAARTAAAVAAAPAAAQATAPATTSAPLADTAPVTVLASPEPIASAEPVSPTVKAATTDNSAEIGFGLLGLIALGGIGAFAASRRRRVEDDVMVDNAAPRAPVTPPAAKPAQTAWAPTVATASATPAPFIFEPKPEPVPAASTGRVRSTDMIPAGPLPTGPALAELFERLVAATPDRDNPFKSDKRRRARVRWLMKQHEYRLRDPRGLNAEDRFNAGEGGFDFRTYAVSNTPVAKRPADERAGKEVIAA